MSKTLPRGRFIVLEGIDGAGTTTQCAALKAWFHARGESAVVTHQPSPGPLGLKIRDMLGGRWQSELPDGTLKPIDPTTIALLFAADRLHHLDSFIEPHLAAGTHVICDRYVLSSLAYQCVDVPLEFVRAINEKAMLPDLTLFLRVAPEVAMTRIEASRSQKDRFEVLDFQRIVATHYEERIADARTGPVLILDGESSLNEVGDAVVSGVQTLF